MELVELVRHLRNLPSAAIDAEALNNIIRRLSEVLSALPPRPQNYHKTISDALKRMKINQMRNRERAVPKIAMEANLRRLLAGVGRQRAALEKAFAASASGDVKAELERTIEEENALKRLVEKTAEEAYRVKQQVHEEEATFREATSVALSQSWVGEVAVAVRALLKSLRHWRRELAP